MRALFLIPALAGAITLPGCSSPTEDVRITLCKNLVLTLSEPHQAVEWKEIDNKFARFEDLIVSVNGEVLTQDDEPTPIQATCFYEYDEAIEEDGMTHVDPLSTYKTVPYKMLLNGESIPKPVLDQAVQVAILNQGKEAVGKIKKSVSEVARKGKDE
jgi:hypothetical protein